MNVVCLKCQFVWDAAQQALCPSCQVETWLEHPKFVTEKHNPQLLPSAYFKFRSVVSLDFLERTSDYLWYVASSGTALYNERHGKYNSVATMPADYNAGSAIPSGSNWPTYGLNSLLIADSLGCGSEPHAMAEDEIRILNNYDEGVLKPLPKCSIVTCNNLSVPSSTNCVLHVEPPMANEMNNSNH